VVIAVVAAIVPSEVGLYEVTVRCCSVVATALVILSVYLLFTGR